MKRSSLWIALGIGAAAIFIFGMGGNQLGNAQQLANANSLEQRVRSLEQQMEQLRERLVVKELVTTKLEVIPTDDFASAQNRKVYRAMVTAIEDNGEGRIHFSRGGQLTVGEGTKIKGAANLEK
jgi:hypothetical protein